MDIREDLQRIAEYHNSILPWRERKKPEEIGQKVDEAQKAYEDGKLDFSGFIRFVRKQDGKNRVVRKYESFSPEALVSVYLKRLLDRRLHITYPNRNTYMRSLFNTIYALKDMSDYTVFKFDFADFFNSVSSVFVYRKYIRGAGLERFQEDLLEKYVNDTRYAYAGLSTSNILCEIAAKRFDELLIQSAIGRGLILYRRYIDDGILIFNRYMSWDDCLRLVRGAIDKAFYDGSLADIPPCTTALNPEKTKHIARRMLTTAAPKAAFDFLGYQFELSQKGEKTELRYGITDAKIEKYTKRVNEIVLSYKDSEQKDMELLRHQLKAFTHRTVYRVNRYETGIWKNKGFLANYCELRYHMDALTPQTNRFLKNVVRKAFDANGVPMPYFLRGKDDQSIYSLYNNMKKYRTLVFVEMIGIDHQTLEKMCGQIGIDTARYEKYDSLVREYLIKVGVGH